MLHLGLDERLRFRVAIKEHFPKELAARDPDGRSVSVFGREAAESFRYGLEKFLEEGRALAPFVEHPNIVGVVNFFEENGTGYLVMRYVDGLSLEGLREARGGRLPANEGTTLMMAALDGLRAVHKAGMLHRDIKPQNIYVTRQGQVKLLDFGAAREAVSARSMTLTQMWSPGYAPVEQCHAAGRQGPWTDIYAVGATMYVILTGKVPPEAMDRKLGGAVVRSPKEVVGDSVSDSLSSVVMKAMALDATERYRSVLEMQAALSAALEARESKTDEVTVESVESATRCLADSTRSGAREDAASKVSQRVEKESMGAGGAVWESGSEPSKQGEKGVTETADQLAPEASKQAEKGATKIVDELAPGASKQAEKGSTETVEELAPEALKQLEIVSTETVEELAPDASKQAERGSTETADELAPETSQQLEIVSTEVAEESAPEASKPVESGPTEDEAAKALRHAKEVDTGADSALGLRPAEARVFNVEGSCLDEEARLEALSSQRTRVLGGALGLGILLLLAIVLALALQDTNGPSQTDIAACKRAEDAGTTEAWTRYLKRYPDGKCAGMAHGHLEAKKIDEAACIEARESNTNEAWSIYLHNHPHGACVMEANERILLLAIEEGACQKAREAGTKEAKEAWEVYIEEYPEGECVPEARKRLALIAEQQAKQRTQSQPSAQQPTRQRRLAQQRRERKAAAQKADSRPAASAEVTVERFENLLNHPLEPVVVDHTTQRQWQACTSGTRGRSCAAGNPSMMHWQAAIDYCRGLYWGGYRDWRLPTRAELRTLLHTGAAARKDVFFPGTPESFFWSSTGHPDYPQFAWFVYFRDGSNVSGDKRRYGYVRCVRGRGGS